MQPMWLCLFPGRQFEEKSQTNATNVTMQICRWNQFEDTFENTQWRKATQMFCFFIGQVSMGTHTLSGTREYGKFYSRDETTYKNDHFPRYCPVKDLHTIILYYCWACCTASYHQFAVLHRSRQVACDVMTHPPTQRFWSVFWMIFGLMKIMIYGTVE